MKNKFFYELIRLAEKAKLHDEVPISAIVTRDDKIISKAYNRRNKSKNILHHAEIIALEKAAKKNRDWRLNEYDLYVTLKPCSMCTNIIKQARIKNVYYLLDKPEEKKEYEKTSFNKINDSEYIETYKEILTSFFKKKRDK